MGDSKGDSSPSRSQPLRPTQGRRAQNGSNAKASAVSSAERISGKMTHYLKSGKPYRFRFLKMDLTERDLFRE